MTREKAIEILKDNLLRPGSVDKLDLRDADQLGIEALERLGQLRLSKITWFRSLLPGETTD
ncbi:hypothetical protein ES703_108133 [subsurface metagenome]